MPTQTCSVLCALTRPSKPRNARSARILKGREPQVTESRKRTLLLHGTKCPLPIHGVLKTLHALTKPHSTLLNKKNENIHPFESAESLEFLAGKNECGLVVWGSSSKKRPNCVTLLRIFNGKVMDMVELLLLPAPERQIEGTKLQLGVGLKPMILFAGNMWDDESSSEQSAVYKTLKCLFLDIFSGEEVKTVDVEGLQYLLLIAAGEPEDGRNPVIHLRWYKVRTKKSGQKVPRVELDQVGPMFDFQIGRFRAAEPDTMKEAMKRARKHDEAKTKKNIETDLVGDKIGRVHLGRQDLSMLQTRKMKGLKRGVKELESDDEDGEREDVDGMDVDEMFENEEMFSKKPKLG